MSFNTLIDVHSLRGLLDDARRTTDEPPLVLLDCRFDLTAPAAGRQAYLRAHIPGARYLDLDQDLAAPVTADSGRHPLPVPATLAGRMASLGVRRETQVVVYDAANGSFAARAWWLLRWLRHPAVAVLDGGYAAWVTGGGMLAGGEPASDARLEAAAALRAAQARRSPPAVSAASVLSAADVLRAAGDRSRLLVDARAPERYAGTIEPIDPVAGHVAGAVNHPFTDNLAPDGRFLPPGELQRRWRDRLAGVAPRDTILMCGSGVTACHNLLAMEIAGFPGAKLYAGSWSEWIRDPRRPIARG